MSKVDQQTIVLLWALLSVCAVLVIVLTVRITRLKDKYRQELFDLHNAYADELSKLKKDLKDTQFQAGVFARKARIVGGNSGLN